MSARGERLVHSRAAAFGEDGVAAQFNQPSIATQRDVARQRVAVLSVHYARTGGFLQLGGAEKYACNVVDWLLKAGAFVHAAYNGDDIFGGVSVGGRGDRFTTERTQWLDESLSGDARLKPGVILDRMRWLRARKITTLVAIQQNGGGSFGASLVAGRLLGLRVVSAIRQEPIEPPLSTGKRWLGVIPSPEVWRRRLIWRRRIAQRCCDALIFNSRAVADAHHRAFAHDRSRERIIPNGEAPQVLRSARRPVSVASVGRVTEAKGADVLLDAFGRIAHAHPDATLTYFGEGPLATTLQERAGAMGLRSRVRFAGHAGDRDAMYSNVDVYVQPSRRESMSNSVVEAMARGIPCVVADVGGLPETVEHGRCGLVFKSGEADACAAAISRLLADSDECRRVGEAGRDKARIAFDLDAVRNATIEAIIG